ncbi:MAG: hypothetical protein FWG50_06605 [Kiritimatiellaeota bacterium]|nr:hypothetical protein [Kiritimatiellota bacterium]
MNSYFKDLVNWSFVMEELSAGVFRIIGTHAKGWRIDLTGDNPDRLMERIKIDALRMESEDRLLYSRKDSNNYA